MSDGSFDVEWRRVGFKPEFRSDQPIGGTKKRNHIGAIVVAQRQQGRSISAQILGYFVRVNVSSQGRSPNGLCGRRRPSTERKTLASHEIIQQEPVWNEGGRRLRHGCRNSAATHCWAPIKVDTHQALVGDRAFRHRQRKGTSLGFQTGRNG